MENENNTSKDSLDWENRKLCSDPACIGVIGPDGRCKECGKPYQGDLSAATPEDRPGAAFADTPSDEAVFETEFADDDDSVEYADEEETVSDGEWENRKLCSDPACIGVIGPDGRCKECGKPDKDR